MWVWVFVFESGKKCPATADLLPSEAAPCVLALLSAEAQHRELPCLGFFPLEVQSTSSSREAAGGERCPLVGLGCKGSCSFPGPSLNLGWPTPNPSLELTSERNGILGMHKALQELRSAKQEENAQGTGTRKRTHKFIQEKPEDNS